MNTKNDRAKMDRLDNKMLIELCELNRQNKLAYPLMYYAYMFMPNKAHKLMENYNIKHNRKTNETL